MFAMHHFSIAPDFPDAGAINEYLPTGIWHSSLKPTTGELITPVLYNAGSLHQQPNVFLPPLSPSAPQFETNWQASTRLHRIALNAAISSPRASSSVISPFMCMVGSSKGSYTANIDDCRVLLATMRHKAVPQTYVWDGGSASNTTARWADFRTIYSQVFAPRIRQVQVTQGTLSDTRGLGAPHYLETTLLESDDGPSTANIVSTTASPNITQFEVEFENVYGTLAGTGLRINFECAANPAPIMSTEPYSEPTGTVEIWKRTGNGNSSSGTWVTLAIPGEPSPTATTYQMPQLCDVLMGDGCTKETRRTTDIPDADVLRYVFPQRNGTVKLRFTHTRPNVTGGQDPLTSRWDLVQLIRTGNVLPGSFALSGRDSDPEATCNATIGDPCVGNLPSIPLADFHKADPTASGTPAGVTLRFTGPVKSGAAAQKVHMYIADSYGRPMTSAPHPDYGDRVEVEFNPEPD